MSPTLLEAAVAVALLWIAWRIGKLLTPWIVHRFRKNPKHLPPGAPWSKREKNASTINQDQKQ